MRSRVVPLCSELNLRHAGHSQGNYVAAGSLQTSALTRPPLVVHIYKLIGL